MIGDSKKKIKRNIKKKKQLQSEVLPAESGVNLNVRPVMMSGDFKIENNAKIETTVTTINQ